MSLLSNTPIDWSNPTLKKLLNTLVKFYKQPGPARQVVESTGIAAGTYPVAGQDMRETWIEALEVLVNQGKLRSLVENALADQAAAAYHAIFSDVLAEDDRDRPMGLTPDERNRLKAIYTEIFSEIPFRELLEHGLNRDPNDFPGDSVQRRVELLIECYETNGQIAELFEAPFKIPGRKNDRKLETTKLVAIDPIRTSFEERMNLSWEEDPFEKCFMNQGIPFINRQDFRLQAKKLKEKNAKRLLVVNGSPGVGKTHSKTFIEMIAHHCSFKYSFIEIEEETPASFYPDNMARRLDSDLTLPPHPDHPDIPQPQEVPAKWAEVVCEWLIKKLNLSNMQYWIALDGFTHDLLPDPTKKLVTDLMKAVRDRLPHVRLILLDYPLDILDRKVQLLAEKEEIEVVTQTELEDYLLKAVKELRLQEDADELRRKASEIVAGLPPEPENHMEQIMFEVIDIAETLSKD